MTNQYRLIILLLIALFVPGMAQVSAQSTPVQPSPVPTPVVPTIAIDSIVFNDELEIFTINLIYTNQGLLGRIEVKVENARTNTLVQQLQYPAAASFNIDATQLVRGESYQLTVTGLEPDGTVLRLMVPQSFGDPVETTIEAVREFEYDEEIPVEIGFSRTEYNPETEQYNITLDLVNTDDIELYNIWLQNDNGLIVSEEFSFAAPLIFPVAIPLADVPAGDHFIIIEGVDEQNIVLIRAQSEELSYSAPRCGLFCTINGNLILTLIVVIVVIVLLILIAYSFLKPRPEQYTLTRNYQPTQNLLDETDMSFYMRQDNNALKNAPELWLILQEGLPPSTDIARVQVRKSLFSIGYNDTNHLQLNIREVSGRHAIIRYDKNAYTIVDTGSTNGTKVNGIPLVPNQPRVLNHHDLVEFSVVKYQVQVK